MDNDIKKLTTDLGVTFLYNPSAEPIAKGRYKKIYSTEASMGNKWLDAVYCLFNEELQNIQDIENEESIWKKVNNSRGLVRYLGAHKAQQSEAVQKIILVFEKYNGGTLKDVNITDLKSKEIQKIVGDLLLGVKSLHDQKVLHLDLKPDNILLNKVDGEIAGAGITDLGLSRDLSLNKNLYPKNIYNKYAAPEYKNYFKKLLKELNLLEKISKEPSETPKKYNQETFVENKCLKTKIKVDEIRPISQLMTKPLGEESFRYDIYSLGRIISNFMSHAKSSDANILVNKMICEKNHERANIDQCLITFQNLSEEVFEQKVENINQRKRKFDPNTGYYVSEVLTGGEHGVYDKEIMIVSSKKCRAQFENN